MFFNDFFDIMILCFAFNYGYIHLDEKVFFKFLIYILNFNFIFFQIFKISSYFIAQFNLVNLEMPFIKPLLFSVIYNFILVGIVSVFENLMWMMSDSLYIVRRIRHSVF